MKNTSWQSQKRTEKTIKSI